MAQWTPANKPQYGISSGTNSRTSWKFVVWVPTRGPKKFTHEETPLDGQPLIAHIVEFAKDTGYMIDHDSGDVEEQVKLHH